MNLDIKAAYMLAGANIIFHNKKFNVQYLSFVQLYKQRFTNNYFLNDHTCKIIITSSAI